ncbi:MAG TPA: hypothetical protein VI078_00540 [bacterium]
MARHGLGDGNGSLKTRAFPHGGVTRLLCAALVLLAPSLAFAGQITISWDPDPAETTVGYMVHNGLSGQPFSSVIDVGNVSSYTLTGLDASVAYHAAVTAYDLLGQESPLSAEVVYNPKADAGGDSDGDGLADTLETAGCTSPTDADTDDDGIPDGLEDADHDGQAGAGESNPCVADTDGDGLQDGTELAYALAMAGPDTDLAVFRPDLDPATATDPLAADTDGDGLADGREDLNANGRVDAGETDPNVADNPRLFVDDFSDGTAKGDPSWRRVLGAWAVTGTAKRFASANVPVSMALIADPNVRDVRSGRIESWVSLTRTYTAAPDARIVFHYQDATHYRYLRLTATGLSIGQVGATPVERAGLKASLRRRLSPGTGYRVRVDIEGGTKVRVYLNGSAAPVLSYTFVVNSSGRVGYRTEGARSLFDNTAVFTDAVLR